MVIEQGAVLGHYRLVDKIGEGGMGVVWKAVDLTLGREVAVKVLPESLLRDPDHLARLEREAKALAALNHPGIVTVHSIEEAAGVRFLTMELVRGRPLSSLVAGGVLSTIRLLDLASLLASALAAAHEKGVVHRDLKPGNVMVGDDGQVKVLDFGLAKLQEPDTRGGWNEETWASLTGAGQILGTTPYMSPEQIQGKPTDSRSDIFALGVVIFEMACGRRPFTGQSAADVCSAILRDPPPPVGTIRSELPDGLDRIVRRCLEKDPSRRYQSVLDVRNDLDELRTGISAGTAGTITATEAASTPAAAAPATSTTARAQAASRRRLVLAASGLVGLVMVALAVGAALGVIRLPLLSRPGAAGIRSLAVLPFASQMNDPNQDYFVEGMHDALITEIARLGTVKVVSRQSVIRYGKSDKAIRDIARELGVDGIIEGGVLRVGSTFRITASLVDGRTDATLWSQPYERDLAGAMSVLGEVTKAIADQIELTLTADQRARLTAVHVVNPEAQDYYLRARQKMLLWTPKAVAEAEPLFQQAIALDPRYARAYAGLSICQAFGVIFLRMPADRAATARASALKAIELDGQAGEAHVALGMVKLYLDWDWEGARVELRRGLELNPSDSLAYRPLSDYQLLAGEFDGALQTAWTGRNVDPASVVSQSSVGSRLLMARRFNEALEEARRMRERFKGTDSEGLANGLVNTISFFSLWHLERRQEAIGLFRVMNFQDVDNAARDKGQTASPAVADDREALAAFDRGARTGPVEALHEVARVWDEQARRRGGLGGIRLAQYVAMAGDADRAALAGARFRDSQPGDADDRHRSRLRLHSVGPAIRGARRPHEVPGARPTALIAFAGFAQPRPRGQIGIGRAHGNPGGGP
jgi:TolB-like protein